MRDSNGHRIMCNGNEIPNSKPIEIGHHVWICAETHILGGASLSDGSILGYGSLLKGQIHDKRVVVAGNPARIVK